MVIVSDTSPLINLAIIGHLHLIPRLFHSVIIPQSVFDEIVVTGAGLPGADEIRQAGWVEVKSCLNHSLMQTLTETLDPGEAEAIALALEIRADLILIDEDLGRKIALQYCLQPLGILGILLKAKKAGLIIAVKPIMDNLIVKARFFVHQKLYDDVLQLAGE